jgi:hypothetical protein
MPVPLPSVSTNEFYDKYKIGLSVYLEQKKNYSKLDGGKQAKSGNTKNFIPDCNTCRNRLSTAGQPFPAKISMNINGKTNLNQLLAGSNTRISCKQLFNASK